jgi:CHAT domain-containing protein
MDSSALVHQQNRQSETGAASTNRYVSPIRGNHDSVWNDLPGTAEEVKKIGDLFRKNKLEAIVFTQANASEENLKALSGHSPQVLHIATHGFFLPEPEKITTRRESGTAIPTPWQMTPCFAAD